MAGDTNTPKAPNGFTFIKALGGISEYKLDSNDLRILLRRDETAPVVTFMVTYLVGSRNEAVGHTGATHLLEHMMFKGTPTFNKEKSTQIAVARIILKSSPASISSWRCTSNPTACATR
jgi:zinc protease